MSSTNAKEEDEDDDNQEAIEGKKDVIMKSPTLSGRLAMLVWGEWPRLLIGSCSMLASSLANQALPRLIGRLIDQKSKGTNGDSGGGVNGTRFFPLSTWLGMVIVGGGMASFLRTSFLRISQDRIAAKMRLQAFQSLFLYKDLEWFQNEDLEIQKDNEGDVVVDIPVDDEKQKKKNKGTGDKAKEDKSETKKTAPPLPKRGISPGVISSVLQEDVNEVAGALTTILANILRSSSSVLFSTYHMLTLDPALFGISFAIVPCVGIASMVLSKAIKGIKERQASSAAQTTSYVEERLYHIAMVKMSNRQLDEVQQYQDMIQSSVSLSQAAALANGVFMGFLFAASSGALLLVVHMGGKSVAKGTMSSGDLTSFATYSFLLGLGSSGILKAVGEFFQGMNSAKRFYALIEPAATTDILSSTTLQNITDSGIDVPVNNIQSIQFQDVSFGYKSTGKQVLNAVSFRLERGKTVALVGKNGSGKSTAAALLAGLYKPWSGQIVLSDGTDMTKLSKATLKGLVQIIPQSAALFNTSILENVRYSHPTATREQVKEALGRANCTEWVSKCDGGMDFVVGLNGEKLSGGQRQRLALARALLSDPVALVMDEPTSALDAEGATGVANAITTCKGKEEGTAAGGSSVGQALLLITHQSKSLALVDEILVMKDGMIVETGTFDEMRKKPSSALCSLMPEILVT